MSISLNAKTLEPMMSVSWIWLPTKNLRARSINTCRFCNTSLWLRALITSTKRSKRKEVIWHFKRSRVSHSSERVAWQGRTLTYWRPETRARQVFPIRFKCENCHNSSHHLSVSERQQKKTPIPCLAKLNWCLQRKPEFQKCWRLWISTRLKSKTYKKRVL